MPKIKVAIAKKSDRLHETTRSSQPPQKMNSPAHYAAAQLSMRSDSLLSNMLLLSSTGKSLKKQTVLELRIHHKHLSELVNNKILQKNLFKLLHRVIYRWQN